MRTGVECEASGRTPKESRKAGFPESLHWQDGEICCCWRGRITKHRLSHKLLRNSSPIGAVSNNNAGSTSSLSGSRHLLSACNHSQNVFLIRLFSFFPAMRYKFREELATEPTIRCTISRSVWDWSWIRNERVFITSSKWSRVTLASRAISRTLWIGAI